MQSKAKLLINSIKGSEVIVPVDGLAIVDFNTNQVYSFYGLKNNKESLLSPIDLRSIIKGNGGFSCIKSDKFYSCIGLAAYCDGTGLIAHLNPTQSVIKNEEGGVIGMVIPDSEQRIILTIHGELITLKNHDFNTDFLTGYLKLMDESGFEPDKTNIIVCGGDELVDNSVRLFNNLTKLFEKEGYQINLSKWSFNKNYQNLILLSTGLVIVETHRLNQPKIRELYFNDS